MLTFLGLYIRSKKVLMCTKEKKKGGNKFETLTVDEVRRRKLKGLRG